MTKPLETNELSPAQSDSPGDTSLEIKGSLVALRRAAQRARQVAQQTGTDLIVVRGGQIVRVKPQPGPKE